MREEGPDINYRHWIGRTITVGTTLILLVLVIDRWFDIDILEDTILAITIAILIGLLHEYAHYKVARKLGYKPVWWRTRFRMGFTVDSKNKTEERMEKDKELTPKELKKKNVKDTKLIGMAPYKVVFPLASVFLAIGILQYWSTGSFGFLVGGGITWVLHLYTFTKEGREI